MASFVPTPARADCTQNGSTVNCTPPGTGGFHTAIDGFNVTVQPGATVTDNGLDAIELKDNNTVVNNGTVSGADGTAGIVANDNTSVTNNGIISIGNNGAGIFLNNNGAVTNKGTITGGDGTYGINVYNNTTVFNFGSISLGGFGAVGIWTNNGSANITNSGSITTGAYGTGIQVNNGNTITNSGSITVGDGGIGVQLHNTNVFTNSGRITVGEGAAAVLFNNGNTLNNTGTITGGLNAYTLLPASPGGANSNIVTNYGTIDGIINLFSQGGPTDSNTLTNFGLITISNPNTAFAIHELDGSFEQKSSGTLALRFSPDTGFGYDVFSVLANSAADTAKLNGTLRAIITPGLYQPTQTYLGVVTFCSCYAGTIQGTFSSVTTSSPFLTATATYSANEVDLTLTRVAFNAVSGLTPNQRAVADALETGYSGSLTGTAATFYGNVFSATSLNVLDHLSGEGTSAAQGASFGAGGLFTDAMMQQGLGWLTGAGGGVTATFGGPLGYAAEARATDKPGYEAFAAMRPRPQSERWRAWGLAFGAARSISGESSTGSSDQTMLTAGGAFGADHQIGADLLLGFAVGGSGSTFNVSNLSTSGNVDGGHAGVYAIKTFGTAYAAATFNYARFENSTQRTITGAGPTENATGHFASDQIGGRFELGWKRNYKGYSVTPFVAIEPSGLWQQAYTETSTTLGGGPGVLGLSYQSHVTTSLPTFLGAQYDTHYVLASGQTVSPFARLSWVHEFTPQRQIQASFVSVPSPTFTVDGARAASDGLRLDSGATLKVNVSTSLFANLSSELSERTASIAASGGAKMTW